LILGIAEDLIGQPYVRATITAARHNVTYPAANSAIKRLAELGILREITGGSYDRLFVADEVLRTLTSQL
jgi:hypothetical protein